MSQKFTQCSDETITSFIFSLIMSKDSENGRRNIESKNVPILSSNSEEKLLLQKMFRFGLYEEIIEFAANISLSKSNLTFIKNVFVDREMNKFFSIYEAWKKNNLTKKFEKHGLADLSFEIVGSEDEWVSSFNEIKNIDFNTDPTLFVEHYLKAFQVSKLRSSGFFKKRYPIPFVIKNFSYFLMKIGESSGNYSLYKKYVNELNDEIADLIFERRFYNEKSSIFDSLTVAELHKLIKLVPLHEVTKFFRENESRHKNLIIELFRSNFELLKARKSKTYNDERNLTADNTAICLSGQLRGASECLPYWIELSSKGFSTFISTWEQVGFPRGAEAGRLTRMLPEEIGSFFAGWSVEEFERKFPNSFEILKPKGTSAELIEGLIDKEKLNKLVVKYNSEVLLEKEIHERRGAVNTIHKNQIKMFYNMFVLNQLLEKHELENNVRFENVIWARPDFCVKDLSLDTYYLDDFVYTSRISDEGRMLDYLMIFRRESLRFLGECYLNLINAEPSKVFGYNHGPRLITDMFLANGFSSLEIMPDRAKFDGLKGWCPNWDSFYTRFYDELLASEFRANDKLIEICKNRRAI